MDTTKELWNECSLPYHLPMKASCKELYPERRFRIDVDCHPTIS